MKSKKAKAKPLKKRKPSGAMFRKRRRLALAKGGAVLIKLPKDHKLDTLQDWRTQIAWLYRRAVRGEMPEFLATKLTYIATAGANFARAAEEMRQLEEIKRQLAQITGNAPAALIGSPRFQDDAVIDVAAADNGSEIRDNEQ